MKIPKICDLKDCGCQTSTYIYKSDKYKYLYFEVPKAASKTLSRCFSEREEVWNLDRININNYLTFAFIRNPWDRIVSCYYYFIKRSNPHRTLFPNNGHNLSFSDFVIKIKDIHDHHWNPCHYYLPDNLSIIDIISKLSNFTKTIKIIGNKVNKNIEIPNKRLNNSSHKHYSYYYNNKTKNIIKKLYKEDIEKFNFKYKEK